MKDQLSEQLAVLLAGFVGLGVLCLVFVMLDGHHADGVMFFGGVVGAWASGMLAGRFVEARAARRGRGLTPTR